MARQKKNNCLERQGIERNTDKVSISNYYYPPYSLSFYLCNYIITTCRSQLLTATNPLHLFLGKGKYATKKYNPFPGISPCISNLQEITQYGYIEPCLEIMIQSLFLELGAILHIAVGSSTEIAVSSRTAITD